MKKIILLAMMLAMTLASMAQLTAADAFTSAPQGVFPLLDRTTRLDMVDYFKSNMTNQSQNVLNGQSVITEMEPRSLTVKMTDSSAAQVFVLKSQDDEIIALISTVATPGLDSNIKFYDSEWKLLDSKGIFSKPDWDDWLTTDGKNNRDEVVMQVPFMLASYRINLENSQMTLTNNLGKFIDKEIYSDIESYLKPAIIYEWNGKRFVKK